MNYTTIEQSKKLLELGLSPETADMTILHEEPYETADSKFDGFHEILCVPFKKYDKPFRQKYRNISYFPAWSLGALIDLLPPSIQTGEGMHNQYEINIRKYWGDEENLYQIAYGNDRGLSEEWHDMINTGEKENLFDAAFEMVVWLIENNYNKLKRYDTRR